MLSDDGEQMHPAYDPIKGAVQRNAMHALTASTGLSLGWINPDHAGLNKQIADKWRKWWKENEATFVPKAPHRLLCEPERFEIPPYARYLKGVNICIDPGHGGDMHVRGYKRGPTYSSEAKVNLRVARFLKDFLEASGAVVTMTRYSDKDVKLEERAKMAAGHDFFLSIHHTWSAKFDADTTPTWHHSTPDEAGAGIDVARHLQEEVIKAVGPRSAAGRRADGGHAHVPAGIRGAEAPAAGRGAGGRKARRARVRFGAA